MSEQEAKQHCDYCNRDFSDLDKHLKNCRAYAAKQAKEKPLEGSGAREDKKVAAEIVDEIENKNGEDDIELEEEEIPEGTKPAPIKRNIILVDDLPLTQINKVGPLSAKKIITWLRGHDYITVHQLANAKISDISIKGFKSDRIAQLIQQARDALGIYYMRPASEIPIDYETLKFNIPAIDDLLGGGFRTGDSYEFYGHYGALKTQIAAFAAVRMQLERAKGGLHVPGEKRPQCLWIDSEGTMAGMVTPKPDGTPGRFQQIAIAQFKKEYPAPPETEEAAVLEHKKKLDEFVQAVMQNTLICRVLSSEHQTTVVKNVLNVMWQYNVKLVVVDSLIAHFRAEYIGRATLANRQQLLNQHINDLQHLKGTTAILIVTNQVQSRPDQFSSYPGADPNDAVGGNIVKHAFNNRVKCRKGKKNSVNIELVDSSYLPRTTGNIIASSQGIEGYVSDKVVSDDDEEEDE